MIRSTKLTPPPPVPPRPSKTIVAEALAKSRRISPIRALYATEPKPKPVVPIRTAPPPPAIKPKPNGAQPQVVKSYSSAMVFNPKLRQTEDRVVRSVSDANNLIATKSRTIVYQSSNINQSSNIHQSSNVKTSKVEVNLARQPSINRVVELNKLNEPNPIDKIIDVIVSDQKDKTTIVVTDDDNNNSFEDPKKVQFDDKQNHEILIAELQCMKEEQERVLKRQRKAPVDLYDCDNDSVNSGNSEATRIQHSDWIEVANNGEEVRLSSCQIYIDNSDESSKSSSFSSSCSSRPQRAPSMSSLHGLPPLPKSLSGFNLLDNTSAHRVETPRGSYRVPASPGPQTPSRAGSSRGTTPPTPGSGSGSGHVVYPPHPRVNGTRKITTLDTQLAVLRREMYGLRQLDLSLLSQLYSLNEAIQDFRQILQDQEDSALSPNSPSPSPSSGDEGDEFYSPAPLRYKPAPPAPPLRRTSNSSSANSSEYGTV